MSINDHIKNGSEPSNPVVYQESSTDELYCLHDGLTKREAFAMAAMQGILSHSFGRGNSELFAAAAVQNADALLKELSK